MGCWQQPANEPPSHLLYIQHASFPVCGWVISYRWKVNKYIEKHLQSTNALNDNTHYVILNTNLKHIIYEFVFFAIWYPDSFVLQL